MGLYNFKQRFAPLILDGRKRHTIRATRRVPDKVGNVAHLYTGLRTKNTVLLGRHPITKIEDIAAPHLEHGLDSVAVELVQL